MELYDFHSHMAHPFSFTCSDSPENLRRGGFVDGAGLLPSSYTRENEKRLFEILAKDPSLMIGEVGLDRRFESSVPLCIQEEFLKRCLALDRPVALHCVRETGRMLGILKSSKLEKTCIWHGFNGSRETALELQRLGILISVGPRCPTPATFGIPFLVETDYTGNDGHEHEMILERHYAQCAALSGKSFSQLAEEMNVRAEAFKNNSASR